MSMKISLRAEAKQSCTYTSFLYYDVVEAKVLQTQEIIYTDVNESQSYTLI